MLQKVHILNKWCSFEFYIDQKIKKKYQGFHKNIKQHNHFQNG